MALFENFPYTNLHELNLDWIINEFKKLEQSTVLSVNGQTGQVVLYQTKNVELPPVPEENWSFVRLTDGTMRGIYFGRDNIAYIIHGDDFEQVFSANNPPPYPVTSVNGSTGNITLYEEAHVELPELTEENLHNWNIFRELNNVMRGIQFEDDGKIKIISGLDRFPVYSSNNPPPYPVASVNGKTGIVSLFADSNGDIAFPDFSNPNIEGWIISRKINNINIGIQLNDDGTMLLKVGEDSYKIYSENDPQEGFVVDPATPIMQTTEDTTGYIWGLIRNTDNGSVGFIFNNTDNTDPDMYIRFEDNNHNIQILRLLTEGDIPSTGVYNINGKSGVVTLYANDCNMSSTDNRTIPQAIDSVKEKIAIVENTDEATHYINEGDYVIWKNSLYTASVAIVPSDVLSLSNLTPSNSIVFDEINKINSHLRGDESFASLAVPTDCTNTTTTVNTYSGRKFSDYLFIIAFIYESSSNRSRIRNTILIPSYQFVTGKSFDISANHGSSFENVSNIHFTWVSDTSYSVVSQGAGALVGYELVGFMKKYS